MTRNVNIFCSDMLVPGTSVPQAAETDLFPYLACQFCMDVRTYTVYDTAITCDAV